MLLRRLSCAGIAGILALLLTACGGNSATQTPQPTPDPVAMLEKAALEIQNVSALRFKLQLTGAPAFIDTANIISFVSADGSYRAPDRVQGVVRAAVAGIPGQIDIVAIGDQQYYKHVVLTANRWLNEAFSPGFNADALIRSERGIKYALRSMRNVQYLGVEDLFGVPVHHIRGTASTVDISAVTVGLIRGTGEAQVDVALNVESGRVERMILIQPETVSDQYPEPTTWTMELFGYDDATVEIEAPAAEAPATPGGITLPGPVDLGPSPTPGS